MSPLPPLQVDHEGDVAPYVQVRDHVRDAVDRRELHPGEKLPPVRAMAADLGLAVNTVAKAYKELEALGVVATRGRAGTVVLGPGADRSAREAAAVYVATVRSLGLDEGEAVELVRRGWRT